MGRPFTQADITRACLGAAKAGLTVSGVSVGINGEIQILTTPAEPVDNPPPENEDGLDRLAREYADRYAGNS